jgi:Cof subfamily protein (haloacid dehalogenase superfamily)
VAEPAAEPGRRRWPLLALDVDGTLVDSTLEIRPRNLEALRDAVAAGVRVVLATGRMFRSALPYVEAIGTREPVICYQGAVVRSRSGEILREWPVDPDSAAAAVRFARANDVHVNLYQDDNFYIEQDGWGAKRYAEVAQIEPRRVSDLMEIATGGSTKIVFVDQPDRLLALEPDVEEAIGPRCRATFSLPDFLEVVASDVSKANALSFVCQQIGVAPEDVLAAGDAPNDIEMLEFAGLAVAPVSAHPEVLKVADATMPPPGEDGVAELVERYLLARDGGAEGVG